VAAYWLALSDEDRDDLLDARRMLLRASDADGRGAGFLAHHFGHPSHSGRTAT